MAGDDWQAVSFSQPDDPPVGVKVPHPIADRPAVPVILNRLAWLTFLDLMPSQRWLASPAIPGRHSYVGVIDASWKLPFSS